MKMKYDERSKSIPHSVQLTNTTVVVVVVMVVVVVVFLINLCIQSTLRYLERIKKAG